MIYNVSANGKVDMCGIFFTLCLFSRDVKKGIAHLDKVIHQLLFNLIITYLDWLVGLGV